MPKKGGSGSRKSLRVEEKAALEAEQAAAVVDAQTAAKEAQAAADAAAEELAVYRAEVASAAEAAEQKAAAELASQSISAAAPARADAVLNTKAVKPWLRTARALRSHHRCRPKPGASDSARAEIAAHLATPRRSPDFPPGRSGCPAAPVAWRPPPSC